MEWTKGEYRITDSRDEVDIEFVVSMLRTTYWASERNRETIERSIENSISFSLFHGPVQVGFVRAITDGATFAWIGDMVISPAYRGKGLGKWMMGCVLTHPMVKEAPQKLLRTRDAHGLYEAFGFERDDCMIARHYSEID